MKKLLFPLLGAVMTLGFANAGGNKPTPPTFVMPLRPENSVALVFPDRPGDSVALVFPDRPGDSVALVFPDRPGDSVA